MLNLLNALNPMQLFSPPPPAPAKVNQVQSNSGGPLCALGSNSSAGSYSGAADFASPKPLIDFEPWISKISGMGGALTLGSFLQGGAVGIPGVTGNSDLAGQSAALQTAAAAAGSQRGAWQVSNTALNNQLVESAHQRATAASRADVLAGAGPTGLAGGPSTAVLIFMMGLALAKFSGLMVKDQADRTQRNMEEAESIMNQLKDLRAQSSAMQKDIDKLNVDKAAATTAASAAGTAACGVGGQLAGQAAAIPFDSAIAGVSAQKRVVDDTVKDKEARLRHLGDLSQADMQNFKFWDNLHNQAWQLIDAAMDAKKQTVNATIQGLGR